MFKACLVSWSFFLLLLMLGSLNAHLGFVVGCHEAERVALLKFRGSLNDTKNRLPSWEGKDCCRWEGVGCDNVTSYVNRLDVHDPYFDLDMYYDQWTISTPKLDRSLVVLSRLNYLKLSLIDFEGSQIPGFIGSFKQLRYLNLSSSNFGGIIPSQLSNLTRLHTLDLSTIMLSRDALSSDLNWVSRLFNLQYLYLSSVNISSFTNSEQLLNMPSLLGLQLSGCQNVPNFLSLFTNTTLLSTIQHLDLSSNNFQGSFPAFVVNMTSLRYLDLSWNRFNGLIPLWLRTVSKLEHLDLFNNYLEGPLSHVLTNMTSLTYLDLSSNSLSGSIPLYIRNMRKLQNIDLSGNKFSQVEGGVMMGILGNLCNLKSFDMSDSQIVGEIGAHHNLSNCITYDLEHLDLGNNKIAGTLPSWLGDFKRLRHLDVSNNSIEGFIPLSIGRLSYLEYLDLSHNNLTGTIPEGLGQCMSLVIIDLTSNNLQGVVFESLFANLSSLQELYLSYNSLEVKLSSNWSPPFQLTNLYLASCKMKTRFPQWILKQTNLYELDLFDNMLSRKLDALFPMENLYYLNISNNQLTGPVPHFTSSSLYLIIDLSYNLLSGPIIHEDPSAMHNDSVGTPVCRLPSLKFLDLQRNNINGSIPDCWGNSNTLEYINLSSNKLSGIIPVSIGQPVKLQFLKLNNNFLVGSIPLTVSTCPSLQILDLGENKLSGNIPISWGDKQYPSLQILRLRGNQLEGVIPTTLCSLPELQLIDLAHNSLSGPIPHCFGHLIAMNSPLSGNSIIGYGLDGSTSVVLKGAVLQYTTTLQYVVDLDLSCNALVGSIPDEITNLSGLIGLNLSHNHLTGIIPKKIGQLTSLESLDLSNNKLSGTIPSSISDLTFLVGFNLSNNKFHGEIPTGNQLQTLNDTSSYEGNPGLCGDPLPNKCKTGLSHNQPQHEHEEDDDLAKNPLFYLVIISGIATGFWGVVGSLLLKDRFNFPLFKLVGYIADYLYMQALVRVNRFRN